MTEAAPKPTWEPLWLGCKACGHKWDDWQPCMARLDVALACLRSLRCPNCGVGTAELVIRTKPLTETTKTPA